MTCQECEIKQRTVHQTVGYHEPTMYIQVGYQVGSARVEIIACRVHATIVLNAIRTIQPQQEDIVQ